MATRTLNERLLESLIHDRRHYDPEGGDVKLRFRPGGYYLSAWSQPVKYASLTAVGGAASL